MPLIYHIYHCMLTSPVFKLRKKTGHPPDAQFMKSGLRQRFWASVKNFLFLMISVVIDGNIIFSNVYCLNYSICMHSLGILFFFFFLLKYANELCILPKRLDCNFKQTIIVHINYNARG